MNKPDSLRQTIESALPEIKRNPDKLLVFIDSGNLACTQNDNLCFEYHYTLTVIITEYSNHADTVFVPMLAWIRANQPDLLTGQPDGGISFEAEIIKHDVIDLEIKLKLTEAVIVTKDGTRITAKHVAEPTLPDVGGPTGWAMYGNGEVVEDTPLDNE